MGSGFSTNFPVNNDETPASCSHLPPKQLGGLGDLPENCLAMVLDHFDPPEICKLAHVNRAFYRASCADVLWESKLPENYGVLVKKLLKVYEYDCRLSKKDIYARLCRPVRISSGTKEVWSEKRRGGICMLVSWKGMKITGIHDRRYWAHISTLQSRFQTIAYLRQIWWLEVEGHVDFYFPTGIYSLFFRLHLGKPSQGQNQHSSSNNQEIHGWTINPVQFKFSISDGQNAMSKHFLNKQGKWLCYHVGDFHVKESYEPTKIKFSMTQIDCTHQKGGLSLDSVLICPCGTKTHGIV
ncbi:F-box protein PP2-A13-like [Cynara cardunculus var. scolymus]|uniref:F-box protein PP2-A13-like n=1 Tax=Cynara cardunculus var. scolymus TaxID=59895 RepID=UPI000D6244F6|nr:F-box protein PP2-A13-like [Cynara cardunculus var. scolymus]